MNMARPPTSPHLILAIHGATHTCVRHLDPGPPQTRRCLSFPRHCSPIASLPPNNVAPKTNSLLMTQLDFPLSKTCANLGLGSVAA
jgi:hypothetical protein